MVDYVSLLAFKSDCINWSLFIECNYCYFIIDYALDKVIEVIVFIVVLLSLEMDCS